MCPYVPHDLPITLRGRLDPQSQQQRPGGRTRVAALPEHRMQTLFGKMREDQADEEPSKGYRSRPPRRPLPPSGTSLCPAPAYRAVPYRAAPVLVHARE